FKICSPLKSVCCARYPLCRSAPSKSTGEDARGGYEFPHSEQRRERGEEMNCSEHKERIHGGGGGRMWGEEEEEDEDGEMERIMMKTMSGEMMRGADERGDDDADDDERKVVARERRAERRVYDGFLQENCSSSPHRSKSCHLATSCLFSTSHRPEGDKQPCCVIGNRCYE
ncbi:hypothetical protein GBF38_008852, partial [Nibea albiflora]